MRAPNVGAFASAPYSVPPCMPDTTNLYVRKIGLTDLASLIIHWFLDKKSNRKNQKTHWSLLSIKRILEIETPEVR